MSNKMCSKSTVILVVNVLTTFFLISHFLFCCLQGSLLSHYCIPLFLQHTVYFCILHDKQHTLLKYCHSKSATATFLLLLFITQKLRLVLHFSHKDTHTHTILSGNILPMDMITSGPYSFCDRLQTRNQLKMDYK